MLVVIHKINVLNVPNPQRFALDSIFCSQWNVRFFDGSSPQPLQKEGAFPRHGKTLSQN